MKKPRVAFFDFASCEGCQLQVVNLEEDLLQVLEAVDVVCFREAMKEHSDDYDIAFVEGSITRRSDEARLKEIRKNAKVLVALGSCATLGGINCIKNFQELDYVRKFVYGEKASNYETYATRPPKAVVPVDFEIHGCPINRKEFTMVVKALLLGKKPEVPNYPVCVECKMAGNICVFELGMTCMGPVTRAGCAACCVTEGSICWGCRGLVDDPNVDSEREILATHGLSVNDILNKFRLYTGFSEVAK
ncbi:MAG: NADH:ubiquinone oxidoreductase [Deltaproteobacteria bacterium]|nr:MAG: NADH:ubiquinone oxidoreductase [Deltaproteobacteria bacterium]